MKQIFKILFLLFLFILFSSSLFKWLFILIMLRELNVLIGIQLCRKSGHKWIDKGNTAKCKRCKKKHRLAVRVAPERRGKLA